MPVCEHTFPFTAALIDPSTVILCNAPRAIVHMEYSKLEVKPINACHGEEMTSGQMVQQSNA